MRSLWRCNLGDWSVDVGFEGTAASINAASLIDVLDVPLTPVWTLLFLGLVPTGHKIQGGDITIIAILIGIYVMEKSAEMPAN